MFGPDANGRTIRTRMAQESRNYSTSHEFEIRVPRQYNVRLESNGGDVTIIGLEGSFTGRTGGGEITIERAKGEARLSTGGGDIRVRDSELDGSVSTGGGMVEMSKVKGDLRGSSGSGPVIYAENERGEKGDLRAVAVERDKIRVKDERPSMKEERQKEERQSKEEEKIKEERRSKEEERTKVEEKRYRLKDEPAPLIKVDGVLHIRKAGGEIDLERAPMGAEVFTGGGSIRIGEGAGDITAQTGGGDITIGPVDGSIMATTGAGTLTVSLSSSEGSVDLRTGNGAAIVELPPNFNGRFVLETAYTRSHDRTRINSDWNLEQSETDEWDSSMGTPRKFFRAEGRVGCGGGVIRIKIVNGDITIRRRR
jgi:hypothetical protein